ncbi:PIN domain-containing protein [Bacteroides neonati]|uniref:PIN domain-containing protein n=1 Tax=Bacteroides neonati TaxID=1347393 RepID=UPI0004AE247D|nr:PIN domain-containing protein [Bacteroides neonati]
MKIANRGSFYLSVFLSKIIQRPIIFWDTCALLDILRIADRENINAYDNYQYILEKINNDELISVTSELVLYEYNNHIQEIESEFRRKQTSAQDIIKKYCAFQTDEHSANILGSINSLDAITTFVNFSEILWSKTYILREQKTYQQFAHFRTKHKFAPAHKKGEYKDCYIWGTCMKLANRKPWDVPVLFFTKNTDDYCDINNKRDLDSRISDDCNQNGIKVLLNSGSVRGELINLGI